MKAPRFVLQAGRSNLTGLYMHLQLVSNTVLMTGVQSGHHRAAQTSTDQ